MNVLRLLIGDATVGPALSQYISRCVQYAVRGFDSDRWAVRNSSMMVFTAVVQRAVDADKNDSGGSSAGSYYFFASLCSQISLAHIFQPQQWTFSAVIQTYSLFYSTSYHEFLTSL